MDSVTQRCAPLPVKRRLGVIAATGVLLALGQAPNSAAHHSFASEFDISRPIQLVGVVKEMRFANPHSWLYVEVTTASGEVQEWAVEGAAPNALLRRGWNRNSLLPGTEVHIRGYQARDRSNRAAGRDVTLSDGSQLFVGSTGVGAPDGEQGPDE